MISVKLKLNMYRCYKNGTYPLVFQIIQNRRKKLIYTGYRLFRNHSIFRLDISC